MHPLKGLVVGLGVLIVISFGLLVYGFATKITGFETKMDDSNATVEGAAPMTAFGEVSLSLPPDCVLDGMRPDGPRLYLRLGPAGVCERIVVVESATGRQLGVIAIRP